MLASCVTVRPSGDTVAAPGAAPMSHGIWLPRMPQFHRDRRLMYAASAMKSSTFFPTWMAVCNWRSPSMSPNDSPTPARMNPPVVPPPALRYGCTMRSSDRPERYGLVANALPLGRSNAGAGAENAPAADGALTGVCLAP